MKRALHDPRDPSHAGVRGADYSLESLVRRFIRAPTIAYKPKKAGETDPVVKPILYRGLRYIAESAKGGES